MRCLLVDLDGTLLGAGGAVTRDGEGKFTLLGVRALEACHRAQVLVVAMSGRPRAVLGEDVRLLGLTSTSSRPVPASWSTVRSTG